MEEKNTKQQNLIETNPRQIVTLRNALGDTVRNYDLTKHNEDMIKYHAEYCERIYAKYRKTKPLVTIGNAEINKSFLEKIA